MIAIQHQKLALIAIVAAALLGGGTPTFSKIGLKEIPPLSFIFIRFGLSLIFLSPLLIKNRHKLGKEAVPVYLLSLLATVNVILFTFGVRRTTATISQMLYAAVPIIAAVLSYILIKEKITLKKASGIMLGLIGMSLIVFLPVLTQSSKFSGDLIGNLMIFAGAISFSAYMVLSKNLQKKFSPSFLTIVFLLTTTLISGLLALAETMTDPGLWAQISINAWLAVAYVAIMGTALYYLLFQYAIKHGSPVSASMTLYLQPAAAFGWAALLLAERLTTTLVIGGILALSGAWLTTQASGKLK